MLGIICFNSLKYSQYIYKYTKILDNNNIKYEVIFWNREGEYKGKKENWIAYNKKINTFQPFFKKILGFIKYTRFLKKTIKEKKYDKLIVLTTQTAVALYPLLVKKYSNKYIFDYRDITYENIKFYRKRVNKLIKKSMFTAISSEGFKNYLDDSDKFVTSHNTREFNLINLENKKCDKVRVAYWGMIRQLAFNYKICNLFSQNDKFELTYHGAGYHKELQNYCQCKKYENIKITGSYQLNEIEKFSKNTDIILNLYENDKQQKPAMTVKFYDSIQYGIPMLVMKNSYMSKLVEEYHLGFVFDMDNKSILNELYDSFLNFNFYDYQIGRLKIYNKIKEDDKIFEQKLLQKLL